MKGMNKIRRGKGFRGVVLYALKPAPRHLQTPIIIGGNMLGLSVDEITEEFNRSCELRKDVQKPVWHNSLRLPKGDSLSNNEWKNVADDYMNRIGFDNTHLRCYVLHDDENGQHIHIIASRINILNGQLYLGRNENLKSTRIIQELEKDHQLTRTKGPCPQKASQKQRKLTRNEKMMQDRIGEKAPKIVIQEAIEAVLTFFDEITIEDFIGELQKQNILARANVASTGKMNGFSFEYGGVAFKASQLGKAYGWSNLSKRIILKPSEKATVPDQPILDIKQIVISSPEATCPDSYGSFRWLQWIPYVNEFISSLKALSSSILKPVSKGFILKTANAHLSSQTTDNTISKFNPQKNTL